MHGQQVQRYRRREHRRDPRLSRNIRSVRLSAAGSTIPSSQPDPPCSLLRRFRYRSLLNRTYVDDDSHLVWCPAPNCEYAVECNVPARSLDVIIPTVMCKCGNAFCFGCQEADHRPCCCPIAKRWLKKCADDSETSNWISANTKECTKCHSTIEKNGGCNVSTRGSSLWVSSRRRDR